MNTIPRVAVAGTSIVLPLPQDFASFGLAISGEMTRGVMYTSLPAPPYDPNSPVEDPQRGELVFELVDESDSLVTYVRAGFISRMMYDEATRYGSPAAGETAATPQNGLDWEPGTIDSSGQLAAVLELPTAIAEGNYWIKVTRRIRSESNPDQWEAAPLTINAGEWVGWGSFNSSTPVQSEPTRGIPIYILGAVSLPGDPYPLQNYLEARGWFRTPDLAPFPPGGGDFGALVPFLDNAIYTIPRPKAVILIGEWATPSGPAALDFSLTFPRDQVEILGVSARSKNRSSALVSWKADPPSACGGPAQGNLSVHLIDPNEKTAALEVAYRLVNFDTTCRSRLAPSDLVVDLGSVQAYDLNGVPLAQLPAVGVPTVYSTAF